MNQSEQNQKYLLKSAIIAKASVKLPSGRVAQLVVFHESTCFEFYWAMQAKNPRSPRRSWKCATYYPRDIIANVKAYSDFHSFVAWYALIHKAQVLSVRVLRPKRLSSLHKKCNHDSIMADWAPHADRPQVFDLILRRNRRSLGRGHAY